MKILEIPKIRGLSIHEKNTMDNNFMSSLPGNNSNIFLDKIDNVFDGINRDNSSRDSNKDFAKLLSEDDLDESDDLSELLPEVRHKN